MAETVTRAYDPSRARGSATIPSAGSRRCPTCGAHYPPDFLVCPKDATSLEQHEGSDDDPLIGEVLAGSFMISRLLGAGGMGRVYEAEHVRLPKRFAVKVMHEQFASNTDSVARFEREAQAAARIVSDHVLEVVDIVRAQGRACIVTELLEGEELGTLLESTRKLPLPTAIGISRQICRGLAAAHAASVVHRDLKPSNLFLLKREGGAIHVKILDFGIAKLADGSKLTQTGAVLGTPAYMAPEQALGSPDVDVRADIYAVGAVLYRMLTGEPPFPEDAGDPAITLTRVLTEDPRRPRDLEKSIPPGLEVLIQKTMARTPEARPATMQELDRLLGAFDTSRVSESGAIVASGRGSLPSSQGLALGDTIAVMPPPSAEDTEAGTKRARRARPTAAALTIVISLTAGAAVLMVAALALRITTGRGAPTEIEAILIAVLTLLATLFVFLGALRVLISRWRSALAIERLGDGLRDTLRWYLASLGVLTFGWLACTIFVEMPPKEWLGWIQLGMVVVPTLISAVALTSALRQAGRV
jgi:serine/threonine protein kinase